MPNCNKTAVDKCSGIKIQNRYSKAADDMASENVSRQLLY